MRGGKYEKRRKCELKIGWDGHGRFGQPDGGIGHRMCRERLFRYSCCKLWHWFDILYILWVRNGNNHILPTKTLPKAWPRYAQKIQ